MKNRGLYPLLLSTICALLFLQTNVANAYLVIPQKASRKDLMAKALSPFTKYPLVVLLHGCGQQAESFTKETQLDVLGNAHNFFVFAPEQLAVNNFWKCWNWFSPQNLMREESTSIGELKKIMLLIEEITVAYPIDRSRIYIAGLSAGAAMAINAAACYPDIISGVFAHSGIAFHAATDPSAALRAMKKGSPISGEESARLARACGTGISEAMPALIFQGTSDTVVNPVNAVTIQNMFQDLNRSNCETRLQNIPGLGHEWSKESSSHPSASETMLDFFRLR